MHNTSYSHLLMHCPSTSLRETVETGQKRGLVWRSPVQNLSASTLGARVWLRPAYFWCSHCVLTLNAFSFFPHLNMASTLG